jgi:hypothetical protein
MSLWRKRSRPIDRSVAELEQQIAAVEKQIRQQTGKPVPGAAGTEPRTGVAAMSESVANFVKEMLVPPKKTVAPSYRARKDLFDVDAEPLKELEADAVAFARKPEPDLFSNAAQVAHASQPASTATAVSPVSQEKLAHYLSAGSIRTYRPLKRTQRQTRNRFFMWVGLSFAAFWLIYVVVR